MNSPLGQYAPLTAALVSVLVIAAYIVGVLVGSPGAASIQPLALVAAGTVFGSAVAVNGWRAPVAALHARLDKAGIPPAGTPQ